MIKGIQRKMIIVKTDRSKIFETAYFVLRADLDDGASEANDLLSEANRIVNEGSEKKSKKDKKRRFGRFAAFCFFLLGLLFASAFWLITFWAESGM